MAKELPVVPAVHNLEIVLLAAAGILASTLLPAIDYRVTPSLDLSAVKVEMTVPCQGETVDLRMPNWSPGYYVLEKYGAGLQDVAAADSHGAPLAVTHPSFDTWHIDAAGADSVVVTYTRPVHHDRGRMGIFGADDRTVHYGGPAVYLYSAMHKNWPCTLRFSIPKTFQTAVSLPESQGVYRAADYDELADSPVTLGSFRTASYVSRGKEHLLAVRGDDSTKLDMGKAVLMTRFITESETDFFGGEAPYSQYVWHIWAADIADGGGGLEHGASSQDFAAVSLGPGAMRGLAHEYFHLWNVKRIRSSVLGPFDYQNLPRTGSFWWLEGVTDYYASLIPHRYGWYGDDEYLRELGSQISAVRSNPRRLDVSPYESGLRVGDAEDGRGNSDGYGVSYYPTGWVLGMMFDIELRNRTKGRASLDDIELALWKECRNGQPGFEEGRLRGLLVSFGGADFGALYDRWVMKPGELPIEDTLAKAGLAVSAAGGRWKVSEDPKAGAEQKALRESWFWGPKKRPARLAGFDAS